jgi:hypothetical protein
MSEIANKPIEAEERFLKANPVQSCSEPFRIEK